MKFILRLIIIVAINAAGLWLAAHYIPGFSLTGNIGDLFVAAFILTLLNALLKPILKLVLSPVIILTLGIAMILINALVLYLLDIFAGNLRIENVTALLLATLLFSVVNFISHITTK